MDPKTSTEWTINVPLSALLALQELPAQMILLQTELTQLRRELEALRVIQSQTLQLVSDLKRTLRIH